MMSEYQALIGRVQRLAESIPDNEIDFINALLGSLTKHGFSSARFYEIVKDPIENAEVLVLRAYSYQNPQTKPPVGLRIPLHHSTLGTTGFDQDLVLGEPSQSPASANEWIRILGLENNRWVDIA